MNQVLFIPSHDACFACGRLNENGLGLVFETVGDRISCRATLGSQYQSYEGIVHGGILASIADAAMVHLVCQRCGGRPLTCNLELRYKASVQVGDEIVVEAVLHRFKHQVAWASCRMAVRNRLCVEAIAAFKIDCE